MSTTFDTEPMSKHLSAAAVSAILSKGKWIGSDKISLTCTFRNAPVLRLAGLGEPIPFLEYYVSVKRNDAGMLVIDRAPHALRSVPVPVINDDSLFAAGGIFAGEAVSADMQTAIAAVEREDLAPQLAEFCEFSKTRTFEIAVDSHQKVRVQVIAFDDESLPAPSEREKWVPRKPSAAQIHAAIAALHMARDLKHFEQL